MEILLQFEQKEELVHTSSFSLQRIRNSENGAVYLLSQFNCPLSKKMQSVRSSISLVKEWKWEGALEPIEIFDKTESVFVLYKNFDAVSFRTFLLNRKKVRPGDFPSLALGMIKMLASFHKSAWLVGNLYPENILINPVTYECRIIDLRKLSGTSDIKLNTESIEEEFTDYCYVSPEQTVKSGQGVDIRSDYYTLGLLFYELLGGLYPFYWTNQLEVIHAHVAVNPAPLYTLDQYIPLILNDIVLKLLSKSPEQRYQGLEGLQHDMELAVSFFNNDKYKSEFQLGAKDRVGRIILTTKLIGRKNELELLHNAHEQALLGNKQVIYITGYAGVGKTRIVREFLSSQQKKNEILIAAKFDVLQKNNPYSALISALKELIRKLLKQDENDFNSWRERLLLFLKGNGKIICDVVPELEIIIGGQPDVDNLPPEEAQERFNQTFIAFIACFTSDNYTLTIFLDDLQWADIASLKLIELLLADTVNRNFLFIGSFRENEVDTTHPLYISLKKQEQTIDIKEIHLEPLQMQDTKELVTEIMHDPVLQLDDFVERIHNKTAGNTFFIFQLISTLYEEKAIFMNGQGFWEWAEHGLNSKTVTGNVVDLLVNKINNFNEVLRNILVSSACLGDVFDLRTLAHLLGKNMNEIARQLSVAVTQGYLISLDAHLEYPSFCFAHDRVRQAALALAKKEELAALNLNTGLYKMQHLSQDEIMDQVFYIANNFNEGEELVGKDDQKRQLVSINFMAGLKAKNASAYDAAIHYFNKGANHLNFNDHYKQLYDFTLERSVCEFLSGHYEDAEKDLNELYLNARTRSEKLEVLFPKVYLYTVQDQKQQAIAVAREGYSLYGIKMPESRFAILSAVLQDLIIARLTLTPGKIDHLIDMPVMKDPEKVRFMEFILAVAPAIYQYDQNLFAWNTMRMVLRSLKYGNTGISSFGYLGFGMILSQMFKKYKVGKKFADIALQLNNKLEYTVLKWKLLLSYYNFVHHWTQPIRPDLEKILEVENGAIANGDPVFAGYAIFIYHQKKFALGFNLEALQQSFEDYLRLTEQRRDVETQNFLKGYYNSVRCLRGSEADLLQMGSFNVSKRLSESINSSSFSIVADIYIAYIITLFVFNEIEPALASYLEGGKYMEFIQQRYEFAEYNLYGGLICSAAITKGFKDRSLLLKKLKEHLSRFKVWKDTCAENFETQYLLLSAEFAKHTANESKVTNLYEKAIQKAEQSSLIHYKAMACELAARYHLRSGSQLIVKTYLENARKAYMIWGAIAKVKQLEAEFPSMFGSSLISEAKEEFSPSALLAEKMNEILQYAQGSKGGKDVSVLLEKMMLLIVHYAGADTGYLILKERSDLKLKAKYNSIDGLTILNDVLEADVLPLSLIKYVVRLKEQFVIDKPVTLPEYNLMNYFQKNHPHSVLVYPIIRQEGIFGVLYLENYQSEGVFDKRRIGLLSTIATQLSFIVDNAYLNENMELQIEERTQSISAEKQLSDELLQNILPASAIQELKQTGKTTAQRLNNITVLLADIKGFTIMSEKLSPEELINKIDHYFRNFDEISTRFGLEKIKTIGDAYMAIGGLGSNIEMGAEAAIKAALEMQRFMKMEDENDPGAEQLELRIGIHTGTVIAGVVGLKKFQYDIWGDTVNIAARMEQCSEPGKVNISQDTYELVRNNFKFQHRGKIEAKNKGFLDMYFVEEIET